VGFKRFIVRRVNLIWKSLKDKPYSGKEKTLSLLEGLGRKSFQGDWGQKMISERQMAGSTSTQAGLPQNVAETKFHRRPKRGRHRGKHFIRNAGKKWEISLHSWWRKNV